MKELFRIGMLAVVAVGLVAAAPRVGAQDFGLSVTASADSLLVSNSLTYAIDVTNLTTIPLTDVQVTNVLPGSVLPVSYTASQGLATTNGSIVTFDLGPVANAGFVHLTLTVQPNATGSITNMVTLFSVGFTNVTTNVVVLVTNVVADLGVTMTGPAQPVITNDWMTYGVTVTNAGPNAAPNVILTNTLPAGVGFKSVTPASPAPVVAGSNVVFNLGTLAVGASTNFVLTVQPTNAGVLPFSSFVSTTAVSDTNAANNSASTNITVTGYLAGQLVAFTNSAQSTNFLTGLLEQGITVSNADNTAVSAVRVVVTGLTNRLFNAVGTNNGNPFVVYGASLAGNQDVNLLLQYFPRKSFPFTNAQLQAYAVPVPDWTPPAATAGTNVSISRILRLSNGNMLVEWPAISNRTYTVIYSDNVLFSNAQIAPPSITAPANDVLWIDYGPPTTTSAPANSNARFYRVYLNP